MTGRTFADLFCGIGGFSHAMNKAGNRCVFACDIDAKAREAYATNFGITPAGDITKIAAADIPPHDILCAGFPCQSFSVSGTRKGFKDKRGMLFYEIVRIVKYHKPAVLLLENVKNIVSMEEGAVLKEIYRLLEGAGYYLYHNVLNASHYGIPQSRIRCYFVALRRDAGLKYRPPAPTYKACFLSDILVDNDLCRGLETSRRITNLDTRRKAPALCPILIGCIGNPGTANRIYSTAGHSVSIPAISGGGNGGYYYIPGKVGQCKRIQSPAGHAYTIIGGNGLGELVYNNGKVRILHMIERKRLMGFPDSHVVAEGQEGRRQTGNAVIPAMIEAVYKGIYLPTII